MAKTAPENTPSTPTPNTWASLIFQLYLALVCGFSLIVGVFSAGGLLTGALDLAIPPHIMVAETRWDETTKTEVARSPAEIEKDRVNQEISQRQTTTRDMAHSGIYLLLGLVVFGFHWRLFMARKA
jgi:hypothetical protein